LNRRAKCIKKREERAELDRANRRIAWGGKDATNVKNENKKGGPLGGEEAMSFMIKSA